MPVSGFSNRPSNLSGDAGMDLGFGGGLGDALRGQQRDETEEEKRRKRLGLSPLAPGSQAVAALYPGLIGAPGGATGGRGY